MFRASERAVDSVLPVIGLFLALLLVTQVSRPSRSPDRGDAMSKMIDLTMPVPRAHFRWPLERRLLKSHAAGDIAEATYFGMTVHAFTHVDAPRHFDPDGPTTDALSLDRVTGAAALLDLAGLAANAPVTAAMIADAGRHLEAGDIALLRTGWSDRRSIEAAEFWTEAPYVEAEAAVWLREQGVKAVGFDFPQDYCIRDLVTGARQPTREEHVTHIELLCRGVLLFEYLCNLSAITRPRVQFLGLPIKLAEADGAPARVVVIED
jgi:arylformamidase